MALGSNIGPSRRDYIVGTIQWTGTWSSGNCWKIFKPWHGGEGLDIIFYLKDSLDCRVGKRPKGL